MFVLVQVDYDDYDPRLVLSTDSLEDALKQLGATSSLPFPYDVPVGEILFIIVDIPPEKEKELGFPGLKKSHEAYHLHQVPTL